MIDREKVINDLNVSKLILCYHQQTLTPEMCVRIGQAINSAIDLLKDQEPKLLTLEEALSDSNDCEISPYVFVEVKGREDIFIGFVTDKMYGDYHSNDMKITIYRIWMDSKIYSKCEYMKTIRFWNHVPSNEQRKAVKWDAPD